MSKLKGKVTLVGAGPGDLGLLTLKGFYALKNAEVVVYDRLVGDDILNLIPENAEKIDAGKKSANHKIPQYQMNKILLDKALLGKNVVRLKGGDCFLFGRGGEELELLKQNNIEFEVVPGITSALAVPAYAGIPITHRDFVSSVHIITGHQKDDEPLKINFKSCVDIGGTLVFLMGVANIGKIMNGLIQNGMKSDMPCAVIEKGTRSKQRKIVSTISEIEQQCKLQKIKSPAIIVVGEVCTLSEDFDWFNKLPLKGKTVIVTRPKNRSGKILQKLRENGAEVLEFPCIETISTITESLIDDIIQKIQDYDVIAFTSPFGVSAVFDELFKRKIDGRIFYNKKIAVIGSGTGRELEKYGLFPDVMPETYDGKNLGIMLGKFAKGKKVLLLRAKEGSSEIIDELTSNNIEYEDLTVYYTKFASNFDEKIKEKLEKNEVDYITFTSASTVKAFTSLIKGNYDRFVGLCIGEKTNAEAVKHGIKTIVSKNATIDDMVSALISEVAKCQ